jgi:hypothetical protein
VRGVILVSLENASFHKVLVYTINWFKKCRILITVLTLSNRGIPTGDPAIVAFYDKRTYKKLRLEELSLSDPLYQSINQSIRTHYCIQLYWCVDIAF